MGQKRNKEKSPTLSLCMIVKNEEHFLDQCLKSTKEYVDEMVIVDTGSTDRTEEIALKYGAGVHHHPWEDDYSKHKNQAIDHATGDWILFLDADEMLKPDSGPVLKKTMANCKEEAVIMTIISYFNQKASQSWENKIRLFRRNGLIHYEGIIHEQLVGYRSARMYPIYLLHYGYDLNRAAHQEKFERTRDLLKRQISKDPQNYWHHHNLAVTYSSNFLFKEAIDEGHIALDLAIRNGCEKHNLLWTHYVISSSSFKLDNLKAAEKYALEAINVSSEHLDSYFVLTLVYHRQKNWDELMKAAHKFIVTLQLLDQSPEKFAYMVIHSANELWRIRLALADRYLNMDHEDIAQTEFQQALKNTPNPGECYKIMSDIFRNYNALDQAETYCNKAITMEENEEKKAGHLLSLAKIQKAKGQENAFLNTMKQLLDIPTDDFELLLEMGNIHLREARYETAAGIYKKILKISKPNADVLINLAISCKYQGFYDRAERYYQKALDIKPDSIEAFTNLGHLYFETGDVPAAVDMYTRVLRIDSTLLDVSLRLASLYLDSGNADECIALCDLMLKTLQLPRDLILNNMKDLATIFLLISSGLEKAGKTQLTKEALQIAIKIYPKIMEDCEENTQDLMNVLASMSS